MKDGLTITKVFLDFVKKMPKQKKEAVIKYLEGSINENKT